MCSPDSPQILRGQTFASGSLLKRFRKIHLIPPKAPSALSAFGKVPRRLPCAAAVGFFGMAVALPAAIEVSWLGTTGLRDVRSPLLEPLAAGHEVRVGTFGQDFVPSDEATPAELGAAWRAFGSTAIRPPEESGGEAGRFGAEASSDDDAFKGEPIWLWILRTDDGSPVEGDYGNVVAHGLFRAPDWTFPTSEFPGSNRAQITSSEVTRDPIGSVSPDSLILASLPGAEGFPGYAPWALQRLASDQAAASGDPDKDGLPNALEFFFATPPHEANGSPLSVTTSGPQLLLTCTLPDDGRQQHLVIETTHDLRQPFQPTETTFAEEPTGHGTVYLTARPTLIGARQFFRLRAILR